MAEFVGVEINGEGAAWVTIQRPEARNALSRQTCVELAAVAQLLDADEKVRFVFLTGAGDRAFCAGADLKERRGVRPEDSGPFIDAISSAMNGWARLTKPTIAVVNGVALGGGLELALSCDLRIAADSAVFGLTEVRLGIMPGAGGTQRLPRLIGIAAAKEMILLGRRLGAQRARELGLVVEVYPVAELRAAAEALAGELAGCAPISLRMAKQAIDRGSELALADALRVERECYDVTLFTEDRNEALRAFADKRPPHFRGE